ncbi:hypothetical protein BJP48_31385 [Paenibacillus odorifer]|nr:hypothetical protein BJP48_31385 [Paenibacillus odorifer]
MLTPINTINIGSRIREDMGDIAGLAESINARGLLHPIVIDESGNLIAGHRRLEAHKLLGREEVETRTIADLTEKEKRLIELEENTKRQDLSEYEQSKIIAELVTTAKSILTKNTASTNSRKANGRPPKADSLAKVSELISIPRSTIIDSLQHVEAIEKFPELESVPKKLAVKLAKHPEKIGSSLPSLRENRKWTTEEDKLIIKSFGAFEIESEAFEAIGREIGRSDIACKLRWNSYLKPKFLESEVDLLRQENEILRSENSMMKKQIEQHEVEKREFEVLLSLVEKARKSAFTDDGSHQKFLMEQNGNLLPSGGRQ